MQKESQDVNIIEHKTNFKQIKILIIERNWM